MARVVHFEIFANDPARQARFYEEALGWRTTHWGDAQTYWLMTTGPKEEPGINGGIGGPHLPQPVIPTIQIDGALEDTIARIQAAGGTLANGPNTVPHVGRVAYLKDPAGVWFCILEPATTPQG